MALNARRRRQAAALSGVLLVLGLLVLGLHALGLHALGLRAWAPTPAAVSSSPAASPAGVAAGAPAFVPMQVRALVPAPPPVEPMPEQVPVPAPFAVRVAARHTGDRGADGAVPRAPPAAPPPSVPAAPSAEPAPPTVADRLAQEAPPGTPPHDAADTLVAQARTPSPAAGAGGDPPPTYATKLPPSFQWAFRMQRGILAGTGTLGWELTDARYRLVLVGSVAGVNLLEWVSVGGVDRAGVAPERFVSQTRGRSAQATNFQRGAGKVTYSASTAEHPLPAGVQDRVSWLVQLAAVVAAAPERYAASGTPLTFAVAGTRDVRLWRFVALGPQTVETPAGRVETLAFRREAKRAHDTRGEVWLDPQRHHLPVRVVLSTIDGNGRVSDSLALVLQSTSP